MVQHYESVVFMSDKHYYAQKIHTQS